MLFRSEQIKELNSIDQDFCELFLACEKIAFGNYFRHDGFLFKKNKLCVPICSLRELLIRELYGGGLMRYVGKAKTLCVI